MRSILRKRLYGDFAIVFGYVPDPNTPGAEQPAMAIVRNSRFRNHGAYVILLESAWKFNLTPAGNHSSHTESATRVAAMMIGLEPTKMVRFKIAEAIIENLDELVSMPPVERPMKTVGEATVHVGSVKFSTDIQVPDIPEVLRPH